MEIILVLRGGYHSTGENKKGQELVYLPYTLQTSQITEHINTSENYLRVNIKKEL